MRVRCDKASLRYLSGGTEVDALRNVDFEVHEGEFVSLVGPSGCGKTSLLRILAGLISPTSGSVTGQGGLVGLVLQEDSLFPWMTALDNAAFALEMSGMSRREREKLALPVLARFGLGGREKAFPRELSAGMKQRVAVARAFLSGAALLLMDEPFGALDALTRRRLQDELIDEWTANRRTVVFVTHDVEEAVLLSSRVVVMTSHPGRIVADFPSPFRYPRDHGVTATPAFLNLESAIYSAMGDRETVTG